jgi:hypothetical protein
LLVSLLVAFAVLLIFLLMNESRNKEWKGEEISPVRHPDRAVLVKICDEINKIAPQYGLLPIKSVEVLPSEGPYIEVYPVKFYLDVIERPINIYCSPDDFDDAPYLRNKVWGEYLSFTYVVVWGTRRRQDIPCGVYLGGDWVVFVYHPRLDMRLSVSFYPYERDEKYIKLDVENRDGRKIHEEVLVRGEWEELLPQFLYWYCYLQQAEPKEIERIIGLALL